MSSRRIPPGLGWCHPRRCQCRGRCTRALSSNRRTRGRWRHCRGGGCTWGEEERMYKPILVLIGSCTLGGGESSSTCISTCISMRQYTAAAQKYREEQQSAQHISLLSSLLRSRCVHFVAVLDVVVRAPHVIQDVLLHRGEVRIMDNDTALVRELYRVALIGCF